MTDGKAMDAAVTADHSTVFVNDRAGRVGDVGPLPGNEAGIVVVRDETNLLTVGLVGHRQLSRARVLADCVFRPIADRKYCARQLLLRQRKQKVRLILRRIDATLE